MDKTSNERKAKINNKKYKWTRQAIKERQRLIIRNRSGQDKKIVIKKCQEHQELTGINQIIKTKVKGKYVIEK